jgi:hypothetical protein
MAHGLQLPAGGAEQATRLVSRDLRALWRRVRGREGLGAVLLGALQGGGILHPHRLVMVEDEAAMVREVFERYARDDDSRGALAARLNAEGKRRRGRSWSDQSIRDILRRADFYLGSAVYRRGADIRPGSHEPVISPDQRDAVVSKARRRAHIGRGAHPRRTYVLQRIVYCACGLPMRGETLIRPRRREYRYYRCPGRRDGRCSAPNVRAEAVEQIVIEHLAGQAMPPEFVAMEREQLRQLRHLPEEGLSGQRARLEAAVKRLGERYTWADIEVDEYRPAMDALKAQLAALPSPSMPTSSPSIAQRRRSCHSPRCSGKRPRNISARSSSTSSSGWSSRPPRSETSCRVSKRDLSSRQCGTVWQWRPRRESNPRRRP